MLRKRRPGRKHGPFTVPHADGTTPLAVTIWVDWPAMDLDYTGRSLGEEVDRQRAREAAEAVAGLLASGMQDDGVRTFLATPLLSIEHTATWTTGAIRVTWLQHSPSGLDRISWTDTGPDLSGLGPEVAAMVTTFHSAQVEAAVDSLRVAYGSDPYFGGVSPQEHITWRPPLDS